ncbi:uncharacterized protein LOC114481598 [Gouania willdenowi]|uniref:uncharacterized protein LOC114481598 n=1 Tax=Gouania willdenowi TaxID=441366 RepID=UPI001056A305|nr:uncharacterized protein LOC114481598 [Gouania willdenowi]
MDLSTRVLGVDADGNMVFTMVKTLTGLFQVSSDQANAVAEQGGVGTTGLSDNPVLLAHHTQDQPLLDQQQDMENNSMQIPAVLQTEEEERPPADMCTNPESTSQMPFAEVSSLLDPNMKGSKARKYFISYDEIKRRLQAPEKMSLRSLAAYTRVSRGPASKKTLQESLNVLGLTPSTTTSVSSSFSKLTEGDTKALCDDLKDFAHDYIDYGNMAKQLIPDSNTVQHWSKIIESKNHLEDMRKRFKDPINSSAFDSVTHGLGLGVLDVALDVIINVIDHQIRILSGAAASDAVDSNPPSRSIRRRHRRPRLSEGDGAQTPHGATQQQVVSKSKARVRARKKMRQETVDVHVQQNKADVENNGLTLISVEYQTLPAAHETVKQ